jgi:hypothetical protein
MINIDAGMCEAYGGYRVYLEIAADGGIVEHKKDREDGWLRFVLAASNNADAEELRIVELTEILEISRS